jgi:hypothetical protein
MSTRVRKKEILSADFKKRKIFWKNITENFLENFPYGKIFHLTSLPGILSRGLSAAGA